MFIILALTLISLENNLVNYVFAKPIINNPQLKVELVATGIKAATSMAFVGPDDILVLEKNNGTVQRILHGKMSEHPLLDVNVAEKEGYGMLGVTVARSTDGHEYVFLYYTESKADNGEPIGNRLYRYELVNDKLVNPKLLLDLPVKPGPDHNGGSIAIGPDNNVYLSIGDLDDAENESITPNTKTQNIKDGEEPNGSGGILRISQNGQIIGDGIIGNTYPLNLYYAYGIRESFGIGFDPLTGNLWDTENGPNYGDEINLVRPGFNSGWLKVQGIWKGNGGNIGHVALNQSEGLVDFDEKGKYSSPEFTWKHNVGPTAVIFLNSDKLGKQYENDLFVSDFNNGYIYDFDLNKDRTELSLNGSLADKIADNPEELKQGDLIFGQGLGAIIDMAVGPDGYLYFVSGAWSDGPWMSEGSIYRIVPQGN